MNDSYQDQVRPSRERERLPMTEGPRLTDGGRGERPSRHRRARPPYWWIIAATAVAVSLLIPAGRHQWAVSLFRQPTSYTALSFSDPASLPGDARADQPLRVSFSISNHEGHPVTYRYTLSETSKGTSRDLETAERSVTASQTATVVTTVRPNCRNSPCRIEVSLAGYPDKVDFFIKLGRA